MRPGVLAELVLLVSTNALATPLATGITGIVHVSPAHPGPQRIGESGRAPMAGAKLQVLDANQRIVARAVSDTDGKFSVPLAAGEYSVEVDVGGAALPRCGTASATVQDGQLTQVELDCDSGMR